MEKKRIFLYCLVQNICLQCIKQKLELIFCFRCVHIHVYVVCTCTGEVKKTRIFSSFNFWYYYVQWYWEKYIFACVWLREFMNWYWKIACIILPVVLKSEVEDMVVILLFSVLVILLAVFGFFPHYYFVTNMNTSYSRSSNVEVQ